MKKPSGRSEANPFPVDEDEEIAIGQYVLNFFDDDKGGHPNPLFAVGPEDDLADRLERADNIIKYLVMLLIFSGEKIVPLRRIYEAAPEAERLYKAMKREATIKGVSIRGMSEKNRERAVREEYEGHKSDFKHLKEEHLRFSYNFQEGQEPRDFFGRMLEKYIESHDVKSPGSQSLYKIYNRMKKHRAI
jgi:hypothetical protein